MQLYSFGQGVLCQSYDASAMNDPVNFPPAAVYASTVLATQRIDQAATSNEMQEDVAPTPNTSVRTQPRSAESNIAHDGSNLVVSNPNLPQNRAPCSADANQFGNQGWLFSPIPRCLSNFVLTQTFRQSRPKPYMLQG